MTTLHEESVKGWNIKQKVKTDVIKNLAACLRHTAPLSFNANVVLAFTPSTHWILLYYSYTYQSRQMDRSRIPETLFHGDTQRRRGIVWTWQSGLRSSTTNNKRQVHFQEKKCSTLKIIYSHIAAAPNIVRTRQRTRTHTHAELL